MWEFFCFLVSWVRILSSVYCALSSAGDDDVALSVLSLMGKYNDDNNRTHERNILALLARHSVESSCTLMCVCVCLCACACTCVCVCVMWCEETHVMNEYCTLWMSKIYYCFQCSNRMLEIFFWPTHYWGRGYLIPLQRVIAEPPLGSASFAFVCIRVTVWHGLHLPCRMNEGVKRC